VQCRVVGGSHGEAGVGVRRLDALFLGDLGRPVVALPVDQVSGGRVGHAFPPHVTVVGQRDVGEDHVAVERLHAVEVGVLVGARGDAEVAGFGVDGVQTAVLGGLDPGDVVTDGGDLPALVALGRDQHGEVGLAAG